MRPMLGRFKNQKNWKNFGVQKSVRQLRFRQGFKRFSGPGPNFRKIGEKKNNPRIRGFAETESRPAAQTLGTVRMLKYLKRYLAKLIIVK